MNFKYRELSYFIFVSKVGVENSYCLMVKFEVSDTIDVEHIFNFSMTYFFVKYLYLDFEIIFKVSSFTLTYIFSYHIYICYKYFIRVNKSKIQITLSS